MITWIQQPAAIKVGNDLVYLPHFEQSLTTPFIRKVYTAEERAYCDRFRDSTLRYASTFAAKEAVYKAVKQWDSSLTLSWNKIAISRERIAGKPSVCLLVDQEPPVDISLSITHDGDYVWAVALLSARSTTSTQLNA